MSNLDDLRDPYAPAIGIWNCDGASLNWQVEQIKAGRRIIPTIRLRQIDVDGWQADKPSVVASLDQSAAALKYVSDNRLPLVLRTNNTTGTFTRPARWRSVPFADSPLIWNDKGIVLDKWGVAIPDSLGPTQAWFDEGRRWGLTAYVKRLQELCPTPGKITLLENNEENEESAKDYAGVTDLKTKSLRLAAEVSAGRQDMSTLWLDIPAREQVLYEALFDGFVSALRPEWRENFTTAAYRGLEYTTPGLGAAAVSRLGTYNPSGVQYTATSPDVYVQGTVLPDFTSAVHTEILNLIPNWKLEAEFKSGHWREISIHASGVVNPVIWKEYVETLAWLLRDYRKPVTFRHWDGAATPPGAYLNAELDALDSILNDSVLRAFYVNGQPVVTPGPVPWDARQTKANLGPYPTTGLRRWANASCNDNERLWWGSGPKNYVVGPSATNWRIAKMPLWAVPIELEGKLILRTFAPVSGVGEVTVQVPGAGDVKLDIGQQPGGAYWTLEPQGYKARKYDVSANDS